MSQWDTVGRKVSFPKLFAVWPLYPSSPHQLGDCPIPDLREIKSSVPFQQVHSQGIASQHLPLAVPSLCIVLSYTSCVLLLKFTLPEKSMKRHK